jgi:CDP-paratose 2-epimerase
VTFSDWRAGVGDEVALVARAARTALGLAEPFGWRDGVARLAGWLKEDRGAAEASGAESRALAGSLA